MADAWHEMLDVVTEEENVVVGQERRDTCHKKGIPHRSVHALVFTGLNDDATKGTVKKVLLQRRSVEKSLEPGKWDLSSAEHLQMGESYLDGAQRGIQEELGLQLSTKSLTRLRAAYFHRLEYQGSALIDAEWTEVWGAVLPEEIDVPNYDTKEVSEVRWWTLDELMRETEERPENLACWFLNEIRHFTDEGGLGLAAEQMHASST
jgi:isopentenyl-diphosphate delta-isomerase